MPVRLRRERSRGWRKPPGAVIVDRTSRWGNPWSVELDPSSRLWHVRRHSQGVMPLLGVGFLDYEEAVERCVDYFERWLTLTPSGRDLAGRAVSALAGKDLICWCDLGAPCHADVWLDVANPSPGRMPDRKRARKAVRGMRSCKPVPVVTGHKLRLVRPPEEDSDE